MHSFSAVRKEKQATLDLYGPGPVARGALTAVRLAEKGVRMVQLYYSKGDPWDAHGDILAHKFNQSYMQLLITVTAAGGVLWQRAGRGTTYVAAE